ncbi:hypothetical protein [Streptomyces minutiscleroticus]|nr:hypothetical protein [Streptomyces minutiscleroticus]
MVLEQAIDALTAKCMARYGLQYKATPVETPPGQSRSRLYGITDEREASVYGYHNPERRPSGTSGKPARTPDEQAVLNGKISAFAGKKVPKGGCAAESSMTILSGPHKVDNVRLADELIFSSSAKAQDDSRVQSAFKKWSVCMNDSGYSYESPVAVLEDAQTFESPTPDEREINMAIADVRCKKRHNVVGVWSSVEMGYQSVAIEQNAEELKEIKENLRHEISIANDALAGKTE